ncbi:hypothetical protein ScPMuIL_007807 [Solemya velum]
MKECIGTFHQIRQCILERWLKGDINGSTSVTTELYQNTTTIQPTTIQDNTEVRQTTQTAHAKDGGELVNVSLIQLIGGVCGGLFFVVVLVATLTIYCTKKRTRRASGSNTRASQVDDYEVYAQIDEIYTLEQPFDRQTDVMLPTRKEHNGLCHRFLRCIHAEKTDKPENAISLSMSANNTARGRFPAMSESDERVEPLLGEPAPELPSRQQFYYRLSLEPERGEQTKPYSTLEKHRRQKDITPIDGEAKQLESDCVILEKEGDCDNDNDNSSGGAIVLAEDFGNGHSVDSMIIEPYLVRRSVDSLVVEPYLDPITAEPLRDINCVQSENPLTNKEKEASDIPQATLEFSGKSSEKSGTETDMEESPSSLKNNSDNCPGEEKEHFYFVLEKEKSVSPEEKGDATVKAMSRTDVESQAPDNIKSDIQPDHVDSESPDSDFHSANTSPQVSKHCISDESEESKQT